MRLRNINTITEANKFLKDYLPVFNKRFGIQPMKKANLHTPLPKGIKLDEILCRKTEHILRNDFTIAHEKKLYQVLEPTGAKKLMVEERADGKMLITCRGRSVKYKQIIKRPAKADSKKQYRAKPKKPYMPPSDHPFKSFKTSFN